ncbi:hypothetical protein LY76DRAFT_27510 [Colletotrichum caudatum]|nr:hypothetical protein LY76DRAFT_27510 [Colletotrichum caudatum]
MYLQGKRKGRVSQQAGAMIRYEEGEGRRAGRLGMRRDDRPVQSISIRPSQVHFISKHLSFRPPPLPLSTQNPPSNSASESVCAPLSAPLRRLPCLRCSLRITAFRFWSCEPPCSFPSAVRAIAPCEYGRGEGKQGEEKRKEKKAWLHSPTTAYWYQC